MASLPLNSNPAGVDTLLSSLVPNDLPLEASIWPPAPIYWLLFLAVLVVSALLVWRWIQYRDLNHALRHLETIRTDVPADEQPKVLHEFLRIAAHRWCDMPLSQTPDQFAVLVQQSLALDTQPKWVNAHYSNNPAALTDWQQVSLLVRIWFQGARR